jgi:hypothetical protein
MPDFTEVRERINKKHLAIGSRKDTVTPSITITGLARVYFNTGATELCKMFIGKYVHFEKAGKCWYFFVSDDNAGFSIFKPDLRESSVCITSKNFCKLFAEATGHQGKNRFFIQNTTSTVGDSPLFEILVDKPINKLGK